MYETATLASVLLVLQLPGKSTSGSPGSSEGLPTPRSRAPSLQLLNRRGRGGCHGGGQEWGRPGAFINSGRSHSGTPCRPHGHSAVPKNRLQPQNTSPAHRSPAAAPFCLRSCPKGKVLSGSASSISQGLIKSSLLPSNYSNTMGLH